MATAHDGPWPVIALACLRRLANAHAAWTRGLPSLEHHVQTRRGPLRGARPLTRGATARAAQPAQASPASRCGGRHIDAAGCAAGPASRRSQN
ncbi:hypothetical protein XmelCFBP4644_06430 [Xanthomonas melonis]|uniref:Uncharacterized protein n=1 Tax=Xanthomonas melonis TaxID=56456 RepID=A0A2S7DJT7_9XANT|nr:hypothetical protein XmelCFBP4644_06430 [Xanthomonas melonis]